MAKANQAFRANADGENADGMDLKGNNRRRNILHRRRSLSQVHRTVKAWMRRRS